MGKINDLTGMKFGKLTVICQHGRSKDGRVLWLCVCDCGNRTVVTGNNLKSNQTKSCGCLRQASVGETHSTHGMSNTRIYSIWANMKKRCSNKEFKYYEYYGGRGIEVCEEWQTFEPFYKWAMANGYCDDLTIDRISNEGNYCPENCRWATAKEQQNNLRSNRRITYKGKTQTMKQWSEELGIDYSVLKERINGMKWSVEKAFETK